MTLAKRAAAFCYLSVILVELTRTADAAVLTPGVPNGVKLAGIDIVQGATANVGDRSIAFTTVGWGLRQKYVLGFPVDVYVAHLMAAGAPQKFQHDESRALDSLDDPAVTAIAMQLTFLRAVDNAALVDSFGQSFRANGVDTASGPARELLARAAAGGTAEKGKSIVVVCERMPDRTERVTYETTAGVASVMTAPQGFIRSLLSLWLGKTAPGDDGLAALRAALCKSR